MLFHYLPETTSTNDEVRTLAASTEAGSTIVVWTGYQTAGRGQKGNHWESQRDQNLLCSLLLHPRDIEVRRQFCISQAVSLAIVDVLDTCIEGTDHTSEFSIKWPNDIYYGDRKICGILIENHISGLCLRDCVVGIGLNLNQTQFHSDAPNPVSLTQITGGTYDAKELLRLITAQILWRINQCRSAALLPRLERDYHQRLYRRTGSHPYSDATGPFLATIEQVLPDGHLILRDTSATLRQYAFKEVQFVIG